MSSQFFWQLPTSGDGRHGRAGQFKRGERLPGETRPFRAGVSDPRGSRFNYFDHLHQVAKAADLAGFDGLQIVHDTEGDESWIVAGYIARSTRHLQLLTEFEASRGSAVYAAKNAISYQRYTGNRFAWQISRGEGADRRRQLGDFVAEEDVPTRIEEFITVARGVITQAPFTYKGKYFEVLDGGFKGPLGGHPVPPIYLSGNSNDDLQRSAQFADIHIFDAQPLQTLQEKIADLREFSAVQARDVGIGLRIDLLARETEQEALRDAERYLSQSKGVRNQQGALLWNGFSSAQTGAAATLIGTYAQIIDALASYAEAGVDQFILAAIPRFEEAYRIGEYVLPALRQRIGRARAA